MPNWRNESIGEPVPECLDCIAKALQAERIDEHKHDPKIPLNNDDSCIPRPNWLHEKSLNRVECGRWHFNPDYYKDCMIKVDLSDQIRNDLLNETKECAFNITCAQECVGNFVNSHPNQLVNCGRKYTYERYCIDYGLIHRGGAGTEGCTKRYSDARLEKFVNLMKKHCNVSEPQDSKPMTPTPSDHSDLFKIIIPIVTLTIVCVIVLMLVAYFYRKRRNREVNDNQVFFTSPLVITSYPAEIQQLIKKRRIDPSQLSLEERVGQGNFGVVRKAKLFIDEDHSASIVVAAKLLKSAVPSQQTIQAFLYEGLYMSQMAHPNLIHLVGLVWSNGEPPALILPYMGKGDLLTLIQTQSANFNMADMLNFGDQIVSGCKYMESQQIVHRDIALNNCLVSDLFVVKISDFGLSREDNYHVDVKERQLRWKWLAPECMSEGRFTSKSDVWAFGILLWEMFSDGGTPYPAMGSVSVLEQSLKTGYRMTKPEKMPDNIYELVTVMWNLGPEQRPSFNKLDEVFKNIMSELEEDINYDYTPDTLDSLFVHDIEGGSGESQYSDRPSVTYIRVDSVPGKDTNEDTFARQESYLHPSDMMN